MKRINFYRTLSGASPVEDFLDTLSATQRKMFDRTCLGVKG